MRPQPKPTILPLTRRRPLHNAPLPAYALPPPLTATVVAILSVSVTLAVRTLFSPSLPSPTTFLTRFTTRFRRAVQRTSAPLTPRPSPPSQPTTTDVQAKLDNVRDRAVAQLDNQRFAFAAAITDDDYVALPPLQRRELLATAFAEIANAQNFNTRIPRPAASGNANGNPATAFKSSTRPSTATSNDPSRKGTDTANNSRLNPYLKLAESVNGRAAALGFVLCLAREVAEPGHPSLVDQVVDVVVPLAQKTPPFLVAVVDQIVDLLT